MPVLFDERESLKNMRWDNYCTFKYQSFGLHRDFTEDFQELYNRVCSYKFNIGFIKPISGFTFKKVLNDSLYWGEVPSWSKVLFPYNSNGPQKIEVSDTTGKTVEPGHAFGGILSRMDLHYYSDSVLMSRATRMLEAEVQYFFQLGMDVVLFEITEIPTDSDSMERLLSILLQVVRSNHWEQHRQCTLVLDFQFEDGGDVNSKMCLSWFQRFRRSCNEKIRLRPSINLVKMASCEFIRAWLLETPAFIFMERGRFEKKGKEVCLPASERCTVIKFMELNTRVVIQEDEWSPAGVDLAIYRCYLNYIWWHFLLTGRYQE